MTLIHLIKKLTFMCIKTLNIYAYFSNVNFLKRKVFCLQFKLKILFIIRKHLQTQPENVGLFDS